MPSSELRAAGPKTSNLSEDTKVDADLSEWPLRQHGSLCFPCADGRVLQGALCSTLLQGVPPMFFFFALSSFQNDLFPRSFGASVQGLEGGNMTPT